jgi:hypothetical protein
MRCTQAMRGVLWACLALVQLLYFLHSSCTGRTTSLSLGGRLGAFEPFRETLIIFAVRRYKTSMQPLQGE